MSGLFLSLLVVPSSETASCIPAWSSQDKFYCLTFLLLNLEHDFGVLFPYLAYASDAYLRLSLKVSVFPCRFGTL